MTRLLVWDGPNMDMQLSDIFGRIPVGPERPDMICLLRWFNERADEDEEAMACVFANVNAWGPSNPRLHGWLRHLSASGYWIWPRPKDKDGEGDIDESMIAFIRERWTDDLREVIIASHDAACFGEIRRELMTAGVNVVVLGFSEYVNGFEELGSEGFWDLEGIPDVFTQPLPRHVNIWHLPQEGALIEPSERPKRRRRRVRPVTAGTPEDSEMPNAGSDTPEP